jgi:hypothetical protein
MKEHAISEEMFPVPYAPGLYKEDYYFRELVYFQFNFLPLNGDSDGPGLEAGKNTSIVVLPIVKRLCKGNLKPGGIIGPTCSWGIQIRGPGLSGWVSMT